MSPSRPLVASGGLSQEWPQEESVTSRTTGCTARLMVPAGRGMAREVSAPPQRQLCSVAVCMYNMQHLAGMALPPPNPKGI